MPGARRRDPHGVRSRSHRPPPDPSGRRPAESPARIGCPAARRVVRAHVEQHHVRGVRRRHAVLELLPGLDHRSRFRKLGSGARVGIRRGGRVDRRSARARAPRVRLPPDGRRIGRDRRSSRRARVPRPRRASPADGERVQPVRVHRCRSDPPVGSRGAADGVVAAVLHVVPHRRLSRRQRLLRCHDGVDLERIEQDRDRCRVHARSPRRRARGGSHLGCQHGVRPRARLLRRRRLLRRHRRIGRDGRGVHRRRRQRRRPGRGAHALRRSAAAQHDRRRHALGPRGRSAGARHGPESRVLLRADADRQARRGVGPGRTGRAGGRGLAPVLGVGRRLARHRGVHRSGRVEVAYRNLVEGRVDPRIGYVCTMHGRMRDT